MWKISKCEFYYDIQTYCAYGKGGMGKKNIDEEFWIVGKSDGWKQFFETEMDRRFAKYQ